jgi:hypothetical protein
MPPTGLLYWQAKFLAPIRLKCNRYIHPSTGQRTYRWTVWLDFSFFRETMPCHGDFFFLFDRLFGYFGVTLLIHSWIFLSICWVLMSYQVIGVIS